MAAQKCKNKLLQAVLKDFWSSANLKLKKNKFVKTLTSLWLQYTEKNPRMGILGRYFCLQVILNIAPQWVFRKSITLKVCKPMKGMKVIW